MHFPSSANDSTGTWLNSSNSKVRKGLRRSWATNITRLLLGRTANAWLSRLISEALLSLSRAKNTPVWVWRSASRSTFSVCGDNSQACRPSASLYWWKSAI